MRGNISQRANPPRMPLYRGHGACAHARTLGPAFPFLAARSQQRLLFMAARDHGLHSDDYRRARQHFISRLFREEAFIS